MSEIICDIDGVIADCTHRLHFIQREKKNWDGFFDAMTDDAPIWNVIQFVRRLATNHQIIYITGRPESHRAQTVEWFAKHNLPNGLLRMRTTGDHRQDSIVKFELYAKLTWTEPPVVIEDRDQVVKMWRDNGLLCLQPKKGDY